MQPYPNPYYFQPYQPMDRPAQYQPTYQPTYQYQPQQVTATAVPQALNGKFVDSIESVKATDVMMDGSIMFFPATDGKAIYTKQLQADGTSKVTTYTVAEAPQEPPKPDIADVLDERFKAFGKSISEGFEDINDRFDKIERQLKSVKAQKGEKDV